MHYASQLNAKNNNAVIEFKGNINQNREELKHLNAEKMEIKAKCTKGKI